MVKHADLDIYLRWANADHFELTALFDAPGDLEDYQYFGSDPVVLDLERLASVERDVRAYGIALGRALFVRGTLSYLDRALRLSEEMPINLRLVVDDATPPVYRTIRWETIRHPASGLRLATHRRIRFSRYQSNPDGTPPSPLRLENQLRALVVVANPTGIEGHHDGYRPLSAVDVESVTGRARAVLKNMTVRALHEDGLRASAGNIVAAMAQSDVNLLYLVCHGMFGENGPVLFLENERNNVDVVSGTGLADRIRDLGERVPTLAVLVSCQSAGRDAAEPDDIEAAEESARSLTAFGPALSRAGCAAVVAMQGNISFATADRFIGEFFRALGEDGVPAHAMAAARSKISDEPDWYVPVLYSRLKRGAAWYRPGFGHQAVTRFRNLHLRMREANCTPLIGSGVAAEDGILPSREMIATEWAKRRQLPLREHVQVDLASVAQYIQVESDDKAAPRDELAQYLRSYLKERYAGELNAIDWDRRNLETIVSEIEEHRRATTGPDNYSRLASMDLPVFITTAWHHLLEDALAAAGKKPAPHHFDWYESLPSTEDAAEPTIEAPVVYHLFGTLDARQSLVLTEDDYFAWLRAWMKDVDKGVRIPHYVKPSLSFASLVFLGFTFDDWEFRMIFQAIKGFEGSMGRYARHVGVQFSPDALRVEPEMAQDYLESYLGADKLDVYWGNCREFLADLEETRRLP